MADVSEQRSTLTTTMDGHAAGIAGGMADVSDTSDLPDMSEMQRLLEEQDVQFRSIKRGDVVEGQVVRIDADEILVDIGLKSEGVLSTKELSSQGYGSLAELHVGDDVLVYVMQPETPEGHAVVSIKRARLERQWRIAQEQYERGDLLEAEVIDHNKGGLIVNLEGIRGFVPISQILNLKREDTADNAETQTKLQSMVGRRLQLKIIEINRNRNRLILSERLAVQEWRAKRREELLNELQVGEVRKGIVSNLSNFGAFVDLGGADGLVHISQLAWSRVNHPSEVLRVGQEVEVQVLSVDKEKKKIALSIKRAEVDPWTTVEQRYFINQLVKGTITKIAPFGAFARIEDGVEGLIHLSELPQGQQDPKAALKEGQEVTVRILRIDADRRRLGLSIRQVDAEGEGAEGSGQEPSASDTQAVSAQEPAEGASDVPTAQSTQQTPAPATPATGEPTAPRQRPPQQQQAPRVEEAPTTAMAAAFRAAQMNLQRDQPEADGQPTASAATPAADASTEAPAPTAPANAPVAPVVADTASTATPATAEAPAAPESATTATDAQPETAESDAPAAVKGIAGIASRVAATASALTAKVAGNTTAEQTSTEPSAPSEAATPEAKAPTATHPEVVTPEGAKPEGAKPEGAKPEGAKPEAETPAAPTSEVAPSPKDS